MRRVSLGEVVNFASGGTPSRSMADLWVGVIPWITGADITYEGTVAARSFISEAAVRASSTNLVPEGTVVLLTRTTVGKVAVLPEPMAINQDITAITPLPELDTGYLVHFLRSSRPQLLKNLRGATIQGVTREDVAALDLALPPLPEQRRVAAILDHADTLRVKRRQVLAHLDDLPSVAFVEIFGEPGVWSDNWPMATIGDLAESVAYGTSSKAGDAGEWPILRMGNVTDNGRLKLDDLKYADLTLNEIEKYSVRRGDMLFNRTNSREKVGKAAVVRTDRRLAIAGYLVRVRFPDSATAEFVSAYLASRHGVKIRQRLAKAAVNQANISASEMRSIPVAVPPAATRRRFARQLIAIEGQRVGAAQALAEVDDLYASLQSRAFRGQL